MAPLQAQLKRLQEKQQALRQQRKDLRKAARARIATPELDEQLRALVDPVRKLSKDLKQARLAAKARVREPLAALNSEHFEAVKSARQNSGLWWGNYNAIVASYETARTKAMKENAELRSRRFTGEGRFTVQIVGGASVQEITRGTKQVSIDLTDQPVPGRGGKPPPAPRHDDLYARGQAAPAHLAADLRSPATGGVSRAAGRRDPPQGRY